MKFKRLFIRKKYNNLFRKSEIIKRKLQILMCSLLNKNIIFFFLNMYLQKNLSLNSISIRNYCIESGRSRGLQKKFWLSRIKLREVTSQSFLCGLKKASW
jgi:ribosomal protein S14